MSTNVSLWMPAIYVYVSAVTIFSKDIEIAILDQNRKKLNNRFCLLKVTIFMKVKTFV